MPIELVAKRPGKTFGSLRLAMQRIFDDQSDAFANKCLEYANEVYQEIATYPTANWTWMIGSDTITTTKGLAEYPLNPEAESIRGPLLIAGYPPVTKMDLAALRAKQSLDPVVGVPLHFAYTGLATIVLHPTPAASFTVLYDYDVQIAELVNDTDVPAIPPADQNIWTLGVEVRLRQADDRSDRTTQMMASKYEQRVMQAIFRYAKGKDVRRRPDNRPYERRVPWLVR